METQISSKATQFLKIHIAAAIIIVLAVTGCSSTQNSSQKKVLFSSKKAPLADKGVIEANEEVPVADKGVIKANEEVMETDTPLVPADRKLVMNGLTLTYIDQQQADGKIDALTLQHPLAITERQMVFHMVALNYEKHSSPNKVSPVFFKEDIQKTKRLLTKALNKALPGNIIGFEVASKAGITQGQLFASKGVLHWRFFKIRGVWYSKTRNSREQYGTWQLVPGNGQRFHKSSEPRGTQKWANWIEAKIDLPAPANLKTSRPETKHPAPGTAHTAPSPSQPNPSKTIEPEKSTADLEEKLKFLKYLHENQLIDKHEYEQKRKDLLNQYL